MVKRFFGFWMALALMILLSACQPFRPDPRRGPENQLPPQYSLFSGEADPGERWWQDFQSGELERLMDTAFSDSLSLKKMAARLRQARLLADQAKSEIYPDLESRVGVLHGRRRISGGNTETTNSFEEYVVGLTSRYELDLWGRLDAENQVQVLNTAAAREDMRTAFMTLSAEIASTWIELISQRLQRQLLEKQLASSRILYDLIEYRFQRGMVSVLDLYQQKQAIENIRAELPLVRQAEQVLLHEMAILLGRPPQTGLLIQQQELPSLPEHPHTGLPADLLKMRPDVRAAGYRLEAADWQVAAARANRLPAIRLTASAQYGGGDMDVVFDNWLLSLAGNLTAPILDGGRRKAEVDRTRAVVDENLIQYRETVLTAVKEVEDALIREQTQKEHLQALETVYATAQKALTEAIERYRNGLDDYLPALTQLLSVQALERNLIRKRAELLMMRIGLYRALGGTWMDHIHRDDSFSPDNSAGEGQHGERQSSE